MHRRDLIKSLASQLEGVKKMGIHNDTCGCAECGNYGPAAGAPKVSGAAEPEGEMVAVPAELLDEVRALIAGRRRT